MATGPDYTIQDKSFPISTKVAGRYIMMGPMEKGIFGGFIDIDSEPDYRRKCGGRIPESKFPDHVLANLKRGCKLRLVRLAHATDPLSLATLTALYSQVTVQDLGGSAATPARFESTAYDPQQGGWFIPNGTNFTLDIDGTPETTKTVSVAAASVSSVANESAWDFTGGKSLQVSINRGQTQNIDFPAGAFAVPASPTADEVLAVLQAAGIFNGGDAEAVGVAPNRTLKLSTERQGTGAYIQIIGGDANAQFNFPTTEAQGTGDFANHLAVQPAELKSFLEGANHVPNGAATYEIFVVGTDKIAIETVATGSAIHVGFDVPSTGASIIGGTEGAGGDVTGADAGSAANTIKGKGASQGAWADGLQFTVALEGSDRFSITIPKQLPHVERAETYTGLSMDTADDKYFLDVINGRSPSMLFEDLNSATAAPSNRPLAGTYTLSGGFNGLTALDAADFIGGPNSKLGLNAVNASQEIIDILWPTVFEDISVSEGITAIQSAETWLLTQKSRMLHFPAPLPDDMADCVNFRNGTGAYTHQAWDNRQLACYVNTGEVNLTRSKKYLNALAQLATVLSYNDTGNNLQPKDNGTVGINFAPAGNKRGQTSFLKMGVDIKFPDPIRGTLEAAGLNYLANMGRGIVFWNNVNLQQELSKLQETNIFRAVAWLGERSQLNLLDLTFDPNDPIMWRDAVRRVEKPVKYLKQNRGLYDYRIFGDQDVDDVTQVQINTPTGLDAGEYKMEVYLKPTPTAKFIQVDIIVTASDVDFNVIGEVDVLPLAA